MIIIGVSRIHNATVLPRCDIVWYSVFHCLVIAGSVELYVIILEFKNNLLKPINSQTLHSKATVLRHFSGRLPTDTRLTTPPRTPQKSTRRLILMSNPHANHMQPEKNWLTLPISRDEDVLVKMNRILISISQKRRYWCRKLLFLSQLTCHLTCMHTTW